jgi:hypothetical protein
VGVDRSVSRSHPRRVAGILGNPVAMKTYREGTLPFPDGTILAKVAWKYVPSVQDNGAPGKFQAFVPGHATTVQIMVKDSQRYASTGGWGFGRFINGKPVDEAQHKTCFTCHSAFREGTRLCLYALRTVNVTRIKRVCALGQLRKQECGLRQPRTSDFNGPWARKNCNFVTAC